MQSRRAIERDAYVEMIDDAEVWERDGGICYLCGTSVARPGSADSKRARFELDHIVPLQPRRGPHGWHMCRAVATSCGSCNARKNNLTLEEFAPERLDDVLARLSHIEDVMWTQSQAARFATERGHTCTTERAA